MDVNRGHVLNFLVLLYREVPEIPWSFPPHVATLLKLCFAFNPYQRPTFQQLHEAFLSPWQQPPPSNTAPFSSSSIESSEHGSLQDIMRPISHVFESIKGGEKATPRAPPRTHSRNALLPPPPESQPPPGVTGTLKDDINEAEKTVSILYQRASASDSLRRELDEAHRQREALEVRLRDMECELRDEKIKREAAQQGMAQAEAAAGQARSEAHNSEKQRAAVDEERMGLQDEMEVLVAEKGLLETERMRMREEMKRMEVQLCESSADAAR